MLLDPRRRAPGTGARGEHRLPAVDFLVAALAEVNDAVLVHYDRYFDPIRRVTGQPMEWLARRGSLER